MDRQMKRKAPGSETKNGKPFVPIRTKIFAGCVTIAIVTEILVFTAVFSAYRQNARKHKVGSYFFGFVNGKAQFNFVWEFIKKLPDIDTSLWMHDIFHSDFTPYDTEEIEVLKDCNKDKKIF